MKSFIAAFLFSLLFIISSYATEVQTIDSLNHQLYQNSNKYTESKTVYRVIKWAELQKYFSDIKAIDQEKSDQIISAQETIKNLKGKSKAQTEAYNQLNEKYNYEMRANDAMEFFSLLIPKQRYNFLMWSLVIVLITGSIFLFIMYKRSHQITRFAEKELTEAREEYDAYRQRTLRREQEVANRYLKEINNLKSQLGIS